MKVQDKGFTLIEVIFALAIMLLTISALLAIFIGTIFLNQANRNLTTTTSHAQYALEYIKNSNFSDIENDSWDNDAEFNDKGLDRLNSEEVVWSVDSSGYEYEKDIILTVNWKDRGMINRSIKFNTIITGE